MSLTFVQGDTAPAITATITHDSDGSPVNLTGGIVKFQMRKEDDRRFTVNAVATIVSPTAGTVSYSWGPNDLAVVGTYLVQWEVTYPDTRIQTTSPGEVVVRRQ
jgi:hypothetical protein